jgi:predicted nuclease of predicted toxin-antitoxin system
VNILIDAKLPPSLGQLLTSACHQARHVREVALRNATDPVIWDHATREGAVIFTKDEDFALRRLHASAGTTIVWLRVGNSSTSALQRWLIPLLPEIERMVAMGDAVIEVR